MACEATRDVTTRDLRDRLRDCAPRAWEGTLYRCVAPRYARTLDLVSGAGSALHGGRWNPPGVRTVYGAIVPETAVSEFLARARRLGLPLGPVLPAVLASFSVRLGRALDLTDRATLDALGLSAAELTTELGSAWEAASGETLGQRLGRSAFEAGSDGLFVPSAAAPGRVNVAVFPERVAVPIAGCGFEPIPCGPD